MWLFLYTEIMLFGGLFVLYSVYYSKYPVEFSAAGGKLELPLGALNTGLLLLSSFVFCNKPGATTKIANRLPRILRVCEPSPVHQVLFF